VHIKGMKVQIYTDGVPIIRVFNKSRIKNCNNKHVHAWHLPRLNKTPLFPADAYLMRLQPLLLKAEALYLVEVLA